MGKQRDCGLPAYYHSVDKENHCHLVQKKDKCDNMLILMYKKYKILILTSQ